MSHETAEAPGFSPLLYRLFLNYLRGYFARDFTAVRTSLVGSPPVGTQPLIVYATILRGGIRSTSKPRHVPKKGTAEVDY